MITLICGEDTAKSRQVLSEIKDNFSGEIITFEGSSAPTGDFINASQSASLLGERRLVVAENFWKSVSKLGVDKLPDGVEVVFWEEGILSQKDLDLAKSLKFKVIDCKIDQKIFLFVESVRPGNGVAAVKLYRVCRKNNNPEQIFLMLVRQFRLMLNPIDLPSWQIARIQKQSQTFTNLVIKRSYQQFLQIDYQTKTSQLSGDLNTALELFLLAL